MARNETWKYWEKLREKFESLPEGSFCLCPKSERYFLKPVQDDSFHLDGMLIELYTGKPTHYSFLYDIVQIYSNELPGR